MLTDTVRARVHGAALAVIAVLGDELALTVFAHVIRAEVVVVA